MKAEQLLDLMRDVDNKFIIETSEYPKGVSVKETRPDIDKVEMISAEAEECSVRRKTTGGVLWRKFAVIAGGVSAAAIALVIGIGLIGMGDQPPVGSYGSEEPTAHIDGSKDALQPPTHQSMQQLLDIRAEFNNEDVIAFIEIPSDRAEGPIVSEPIAQGADNDYYLRRHLDGRLNAAGTLFIDYRNSPGFTDHNTIIYGHNMLNRSRFGNLRYYTSWGNEDWARQHQYIYITTLYEVTVWRVFAAYQIGVVPLVFDYTGHDFNTREERRAFLDEVRRRAQAPNSVEHDGGFFYFDYGVGPDDIIITLSTCTNIRYDQRYVIHAVLVERR